MDKPLRRKLTIHSEAGGDYSITPPGLRLLARRVVKKHRRLVRLTCAAVGLLLFAAYAYSAPTAPGVKAFRIGAAIVDIGTYTITGSSLPVTFSNASVSITASTMGVTDAGGSLTVDGTVTASPTAGALSFGVVSISSTAATEIVAALSTRKCNPTICSEDGTQVYLGSSTVTSGNSLSISTNPKCWWPEGPGVSTTAVYGIAVAGTSGSHTVSWSDCR